LSLYILHRLLPPRSPSGLDAAVPLDTAVEEFLAWEGKLTHWEEALFMREDEAWIPEQALVQASTALDEEWAKADATQ
jgi:hypothetical protein